MTYTRARAVFTGAIGASICLAVGCAGPPEVDDQTGRAVSDDGVRIGYDVHGSGATTLVFVHGWSCDRHYWRSQVQPFRGDHRVVTLDLAGHGSSGTERSSWSIANFANDVAAVVRALGTGDVILIGHSLGGPVVLEAALLLADTVVGVVGVDTFFDLWADPAMREGVDQLRGDFRTETHALVRGAMFLPTSPAALADSIADAMSSAPPQIAIPAMDGLVTWALTRQAAAVAALDAPIGLIKAAGSPPGLTRFEQARGAAPSLGIDVLPGVGHFLMLEAPDVFNATLRRMIEGIPRGPQNTRLHAPSGAEG